MQATAIRTPEITTGASRAPRVNRALAVIPARPVGFDPGQLSWSQIAEQYYGPVFRHAYKLTQNRSDAEDLTQDTFCKVFRSLDHYHQRPGGSFEGWLRRITTNLFLDSKRRQARIRMEALSDEAGDFEDTQAGPERLVEVLSANASLASALQRLNPALLEALVMRDVEGRSHQEIAGELGVAPGTVRSRLHRARAQARAVIEP
ncbi:MAG: sigma-70 family RNA polymerase sigma factor [Bifidobacteriaceae bacterium]|jgi:RNA polymerase sigma-70 factor (ECF subfamily)|nr:sigma-70 family RNA polymerase sigma factor [Bifidobacteriaceae bacterium]